MIYTAENIPLVDPMMIRGFQPNSDGLPFGGVMMFHEYAIKPMSMATGRMGFDEEVVDCSQRMLEITNFLLAYAKKAGWWTVFPSRRWRSGRLGENITILPGKDIPFLYIGNPIRLHVDPEGALTVFRTPEFLIKSACALGY